MAADTGMKNINAVENYAKNLNSVSIQVKQVFERVKQQTEQISNNWNDTQFNSFRDQFNENIIKQVEGICMTLEKLSMYAKKQCEFHTMAQQHRL